MSTRRTVRSAYDGIGELPALPRPGGGDGKPSNLLTPLLACLDQRGRAPIINGRKVWLLSKLRLPGPHAAQSCSPLPLNNPLPKLHHIFEPIHPLPVDRMPPRRELPRVVPATACWLADPEELCGLCNRQKLGGINNSTLGARHFAQRTAALIACATMMYASSR